MELELTTKVREIKGKKAKLLRQEGIVPAVIYGYKVDPTLIQVEAKQLGKVLKEAGTYQLITINVEGQKPFQALARDIQQDPIRFDYIHVDFYAVNMQEKVQAQVPIILEGTAPAVLEQGGVLTQGLDEIEIECLPADLVSEITVSVTGLAEINDLIIISDLDISDSLTVLSDPDSMVAKIEPPRILAEDKEEDEEEELMEASVEPEVITARDEDEGDEE